MTPVRGAYLIYFKDKCVGCLGYDRAKHEAFIVTIGAFVGDLDVALEYAAGIQAGENPDPLQGSYGPVRWEGPVHLPAGPIRDVTRDVLEAYLAANRANAE